jgi:hypothetical protein
MIDFVCFGWNIALPAAEKLGAARRRMSIA